MKFNKLMTLSLYLLMGSISFLLVAQSDCNAAIFVEEGESLDGAIVSPSREELGLDFPDHSHEIKILTAEDEKTYYYLELELILNNVRRYNTGQIGSYTRIQLYPITISPFTSTNFSKCQYTHLTLECNYSPVNHRIKIKMIP